MSTVNKMKTWEDVQAFFDKRFGEPDVDLDSVLFTVGLQELGVGFRKFNKNQKLDVMHIGVCTLLMPYDIYEFKGRDEDGWPHFERTANMPALAPGDQEKLVKEAILEYFQGV